MNELSTSKRSKRPILSCIRSIFPKLCELLVSGRVILSVKFLLLDRLIKLISTIPRLYILCELGVEYFTLHMHIFAQMNSVAGHISKDYWGEPRTSVAGNILPFAFFEQMSQHQLNHTINQNPRNRMPHRCFIPVDLNLNVYRQPTMGKVQNKSMVICVTERNINQRAVTNFDQHHRWTHYPGTYYPRIEEN